jgi:hypothetical protein
MSVAQGSGSFVVGGSTFSSLGNVKFWQFRKVADRIKIVLRNIKFKANPNTPEQSAIDVAYSDNIVYSLPIIATDEVGGDVIDFGSIFMSNFVGIGDKIGTFSRNRSYWGSAKGFQNNIEFRVVATYSGVQYGNAFR